MEEWAWTSSSPENDCGGWHMSNAAYQTLLDLREDVCRRNGIQELRTEDTAGMLPLHRMSYPETQCPGPYLERRREQIAAEASQRLREWGAAAERDAKRWG